MSRGLPQLQCEQRRKALARCGLASAETWAGRRGSWTSRTRLAAPSRVTLHRMNRALLGFAILPSFLLASEALAETKPQTVNLTVVSRCGASLALQKAGLNTQDGGPVADIPLTRVGSFFYIGNTTVAPGRYLIGVSVLPKCWGAALITVLPGHDRNVGIEVTPLGTGHYDAYAFLYGTLPFAGFVSGTLTYVSGPLNLKGVEDPVEVDSGAYYVEHAYPGVYLLKLSYGDSLQCRIRVVVPKQGARLDVSADQAQQCLGFPYHYPSTGESGFILLFPSPSPNPK
jgi:hypothetical protein